MKIRIAVAALLLAVIYWTPLPATSTLMPVADIKPGMVGTGRTVFEGTDLQEFKAQIIGVLHNVAVRSRRPASPPA
jgi:hypothetical protein